MQYYDKNCELHKYYVESLLLPGINKIKKHPKVVKAVNTVKIVKETFSSMKNVSKHNDEYAETNNIIDINLDDIEDL